MATLSFSLFETVLGRCSIIFSEHGIVGVQLPERTLRESRSRVRERFPNAREAAPSKEAQQAIDGIVALLRGEASDLSAIDLDMSDVPPFHRRVYEAARKIVPGETLSYGEVATRVGSPGAARAVGQALGRNPFAVIVPCHRVLAAQGKIGGFTATGGVDTKKKMLAIETARAQPAPNAQDHGFAYDPKEAVKYLRQADNALKRIIDAVGPFTLTRNRTQSAFNALAEAIVYQQLTGKAAATIFGRVKALFLRSGLTPLAVTRCAEEKLRGAGLSQAKMLALKDLAQKTTRGEVPTLEAMETMDDAAIIESLSQVRGIGQWTAEMFLIFRLGRPDVLPVDDYGIRKGFAVMTKSSELPSKQALAAYGARYEPYRSVASWYLWRATELAQG